MYHDYLNKESDTEIIEEEETAEETVSDTQEESKIFINDNLDNVDYIKKMHDEYYK